MGAMLSPSLVSALARSAAETPGVRLVLLFGSAARGQARTDSDADIGVLGGKFWDQMQLGGELSVGLRREPHVVDLAEVSDWLRFEAARDGILIYESEPGLWSGFKATAMLRFFDLVPIISICADGVRRRLIAEMDGRARG
jgi:predicted nucleotidyltransferase